jgi:peptide/nickel transport system substrate-binding protein
MAGAAWKFLVSTGKLTGAFGVVFLGLALVIAGAGRLAWRLSVSSEPAGEDLTDIAAVDRQPGQARGAHSVAEWSVLWSGRQTESGANQTTSRGQAPLSNPAPAFTEAPALARRVADGTLPPVAQRLPRDPLVIVPPESRGPYGGTWRRFAIGAGDIGTVESRLSYEGLVRWDAAARAILPNLAVRWTIEDGGKTYTFFLRHGVRWSDGQPFTAADIQFWYENVLLNTELTAAVPPEFRRGGETMQLEKVDDHTIRFRFKECYGLFLKMLASGSSISMCRYPAHYFKRYHVKFTPVAQLEAAAREHGMRLWYQWFTDRADWRNPEVPRLWAWVLKVPPPAQPVVFERNPFYWKVDPDGRQLPYIDRLVFEECALETINMKAINGEIGMQDRHVAFANYPLFMENQRRGRYQVRHWIDGSGSSAVLLPNLNHRDPVLRELLGDSRFRIALSLAINRQEINEWHYLGIGEPRQVAPPPTSAFYSSEYERAFIDYDPARANRMLDEMGLATRDAAGMRLRPDGRPLTLYIETTDSYWWPFEAIQRVAEYWTAVGVKTDVRLQARPLWEQRVWARVHDLSVWSGADDLQPLLDPRWFFPANDASEQALDYAQWFNTDGRRGLEPPPAIRRCMDLFRQIERTVDESEQERLFRGIVQLNAEHLWVIGLVGRIPPLVLVKEGFLNVPQAAVVGWMFRTPGNTAPECYAIQGGR